MNVPLKLCLKKNSINARCLNKGNNNIDSLENSQRANKFSQELVLNTTFVFYLSSSVFEIHT